MSPYDGLNCPRKGMDIIRHFGAETDLLNLFWHQFYTRGVGETKGSTVSCLRKQCDSNQQLESAALLAPTPSPPPPTHTLLEKIVQEEARIWSPQ